MLDFFKFFIFLKIISLGFGSLTFSNLECKSFDKTYVEFEYCYIKAINRSLKYMSSRAILHQLPVDNVKVNFAVSKRANGWKPFLYNYTVDGCLFMKKRNSFPVIKYLFGLFEKFSNINHTCPYNHDIIVNNVTTSFVENEVTNVLPFPKGEYRLQMSWSTHGKLRCDVFASLRLT